jgi:topoisomerase-4 subunit A
LVIRRDGTYLATKVAEKTFVGKDILHVSVFRKNDTRTIFNIIYLDGASGFSYVKRCAINGLTRDKEYNLTQGTPYSKIQYFSVNPNGEAETVKVKLKPRPRLKVLDLIFNFAELAVKGRNALGNILTKHAIHKIELKEKGVSTIGGAAIWFDNDTFRLNSDERGTYLGQFIGNDKILVLNQKGEFYTSSYELTNHFDDDIVFIEKYTPDKVFSIVYFDAEQQFYYVKRCAFELSDRPQNFIDDNPKSKLILFSEEYFPQFKVDFGGKHKSRPAEIIDVEQFIGVKSFRAKGRRLTTYEVKAVNEIEPLQKEIPVKADEPQEPQGGIADIKEEDIFKNTTGGNPIEPSLF